MDPMTMALVGSAAAGGASDLLASGLNFAQNAYLQGQDHEFQSNEAAASRIFQASQAQLNRDWQTRANAIAMGFSDQQRIAQNEYNKEMSNTAVQRRMSDMRSAGINPILAASSGMAADTPAGATGQGFAGTVSNPGTAATAHGSASHVAGTKFGNFANMIGQFMSTAHEVSMLSDKFQHDREMLELRQSKDKKRGASGATADEAEAWFNKRLEQTFGK